MEDAERQKFIDDIEALHEKIEAMTEDHRAEVEGLGEQIDDMETVLSKIKSLF